MIFSKFRSAAGAAVLSLILVSSALPLTASAARTVASATVNGGSSTSVYAKESIAAVMNVTTTGTGNASHWQSLGWRVGLTLVTCVNFPTPHLTAGSYSEAFTVVPTNAPGTYNLVLTAYSGQNCTAESGTGTGAASFTLGSAIVVKPSTIVISTASLPNGTAGIAYSAPLSVTKTGTTATTTWTRSAGTLPPGLALTPTTGDIIALSGTPTTTAGGTYTFTLKAAAGTINATKSFTVVIAPAPTITINPATLSNPVVGTPYSQTFTASTTAPGPYTWSVSAGTLPAGLSLSTTTGVLSGTPTTATTSTFTIKAVAGISSGTSSYTVTVAPATVVPPPPAVTIVPASLTDGVVNTAYTQALTASTTASGPFTWSVASGTLPLGLTFNAATGIISGTPTTAGTSAFSVFVTNGVSSTTQSYTLNITAPVAQQNLILNPSLETAAGSLPANWKQGGWGTNDRQFTYPVAGVTGSGAQVTIGTFTDGDAKWYFDDVAVTPGTTYTFSDAYKATTGSSLVAQYTLVGGTVSYVLLNTLPSSGGAWATTTVNTTAPANAASITIFHLIDSVGSLTIDNASLTSAAAVPPPAITLTPSTLGNGTQNSAYAQTLTANTTATGPFTWSISTGALPAGIILSSGTGLTNTISGTPTTAGTSTFSVKITNGTSSTTANYTLAVSAFIPPTITLGPTTLASSTVGTSLSQTLTASTTASGPFTWSISSGALPAGVTLGSGTGLTNTLSGTPTTSGTASFAVTVTNGISSVTQNYTWVINAQQTTQNLVPNPGFETTAGSLPLNWQTSKWGTNTTQFTYPVPGVTGSAAKVAMTSFSSGDAKWYFTDVPVTPNTPYIFSDSYNATIGTSIVAQFTLSGGSVVYVPIIDAPATGGNWSTISGSVTAPTGAVSVTIFHLIAGVGSLTIDNVSLVSNAPNPQDLFSKGLVTLTFDDGWLTQYTNALPILTTAGLPGTFYIIPDRMNDVNEPTYMRSDKVLALQAAGHEIGAHTMDHCNLVSLYNDPTSATGAGCPDGVLSGPSTANYQITQSRTVLQQLTGSAVDSFAYPYGSGAGNAGVEAIVSGDGFTSGRGVGEGFNTKATPKYALLVQNIGSSVTDFNGTVKPWIDYAAANKVWLIFMFHQVENSQSVLNANGETSGTTKAMLTSIANYVKTQKDAGTINVATMHDAMTNYMAN